MVACNDVVPQDRPEHGRPAGAPELTHRGYAVNYHIGCRDCGERLYLHDLVDHFDHFNGGWVCTACMDHNPLACDECGVVQAASQMSLASPLNGVACANCFPIVDANLRNQIASDVA